MNIKPIYTIDGVDLNSLGVHVLEAKGLLSIPKMKRGTTEEWNDEHGRLVDLARRYYEPRKLSLSCLIKAETPQAITAQFAKLKERLQAERLLQLEVTIGEAPRLAYMVYLDGETALAYKGWEMGLMVATFRLTFTEPEPIKRIIQTAKVGEVTLEIETDKALNIYWGDFSHEFDVLGKKTLTHKYKEAKERLIVITGDIEHVKTAKPTKGGTILWDTL